MSTPNPENGGFIFRLTPSTISSGQQLAGFPASNLLSNNPNEIYMSDQSSITFIRFGYNAPTTLTGIAIINHSIPENALIQINCFTGDWETYITSVPVPWNCKNLYHKLEAINYQSYALQINSSAISIGELVPGTAFQFPYNYEWGFEESFTVVKEVVTSDEGVHFEVPAANAPEYSRFSIKFSNSPANNLSSFYDIIRIGKKVFIPDFTQPECYFGIVPDKELKATRAIKGDEYPIRFWEDAVSGTWLP